MEWRHLVFLRTSVPAVPDLLLRHDARLANAGSSLALTVRNAWAPIEPEVYMVESVEAQSAPLGLLASRSISRSLQPPLARHGTASAVAAIKFTAEGSRHVKDRADGHSTRPTNRGLTGLVQGSREMMDSVLGPELIAYHMSWLPPMPIVPADQARAWMDATNQHFANRCLPLLIANQSGWAILSTHTFEATWNGNVDTDAIQITYLEGDEPYPAISHFGHGIITWHVPYIFRTSPGWNLWVRGPANWPKDSIVPLEGVVESDWIEATFTMNWMFTRPDETITFEVDEPICMILPHRRHELESVRPEIRELAERPDILDGYTRWSQSRTDFNASIQKASPGTSAWQKNYFRGNSVAGRQAPEHQTKLRLREFKNPDS